MYESAGLKNTQFSSFAKFSRYADNIVIPINGMGPPFPGWHIDGRFWFNKNNLISYLVPIPLNSQKGKKFININEKYLIINNIDSVCERSEYIGLVIAIFHEQQGWIRAFWRGSGSFSKESSLNRWYPSGFIAIQYAFQNKKNILIKIDVLHAKNNIRKISIYCPTNKFIFINSLR